MKYKTSTDFTDRENEVRQTVGYRNGSTGFQTWLAWSSLVCFHYTMLHENLQQVWGKYILAST